MSQQDLEINRNIRKVFVRHWMDLGRLGVHCSQGRVTIRGSLQHIQGVKTDITPQTIKTFVQEINRIQNIRWLNIELDNWVEVEGSWQVLVRPTTLPTSVPAPAVKQRYNLDTPA